MASQVKTAAPDIIHKLVETFEQNLDAYRSSKNETELRREFLDKFFAALGWDVANEKGYDEAHKEVVHEFSVEVSGQQKKADYAFRAGAGRFDFLVEAKKPSVKIESSQDAAFQIRRYGWSAKLPINILTDFEHFAVYDCRAKPSYNDKASTGRILLIHYKEYAERWDEIAALFSPEAIRRGSLARYAEETKGKKGTADVDDAFLQEIERWRELLAKNIALRNPEIDVAGLNYAVQMTIDRIVFLRICEERGIEPENQLHDLAERDGVYEELRALFQRADTRYNSGLFHFKSEKGESSRPDDLTLTLKMDDRVLRDVISNLYYPKSPYAFLYIPADILGQVYERFLGKVIRLTAGHSAKVEEKPEVRKAGGVYYTPTYIVEYIVKHTVGKLVENKSPKEAAALKILDPACGSGTFLLGAYQYLLDWHLNWYVNDDAEKWVRNKALVKVGGDYRLAMAKRKEILLNNIFGVDIDAQAVEVTKLSLLLKALEGVSGQMELGMERVLPDLGNNVKCGNSLIGWDYFEGRLMPDEEEIRRVNPFDWEREFPQAFAQGGFDAVIGNPPYIRIQAMQEWASGQAEYFKQKYKAASKGNYDIYVVFIEKALSLLNEAGRLGFILPHKFFNAQYGEPVRGLISQGKHISKIVHFGDQQVFAGATTYTCLLFLNRQSQNEFEFTRVSDLESWQTVETSEISGTINTVSVSSAEWNFTVGKGAALFEKLSQMPVKLGDVTDRIFQGLVTGADPVFILKNVEGGKYYSEATKKEYAIEKNLMHLLCKGSVNIRRYSISQLEKSILFPYKLVDGKAILLSPKELEARFPVAWQYLKENKVLLESRERGKWKHDKWYAFGRSQNLSEMEQKKILTPSIANRASFTLDSMDYYYFVGSGGGGGGGYGITLKTETQMTYEYLLGLLNSKLLDVYLKAYSSSFSGGYFAYNRQYIEQLPIRPIDFTNPAEKAQHDKMVSLVERMLSLHKALAAAQSPAEKERLERQIEVTDRAIDALVYELYGLTEEEIRIVEGG
ncbi:MAG: Eco57I restriction-modification methylase domain-containing protein [Chloroflexota bacterium]|jgi:predicted type IV restriction endonuclease